jgi:phosphatidylserine decarboxylase
MKRRLTVAILYWIPKNLLSYWVGKLMYVRFPQPLQLWLIKAFASLYRIKVDEAERSIETYPSLGDFFVRHLKPGCRPVGATDYVHPADSKMTARGLVIGNKALQAKGSTYSLSEFLKDSSIDRWQQGFFITYYLCPTDYHRVHSPVDGVIKEVRYVPGNLWPVNDWSIKNIQDLFVKNERVIVEIETPKGPVAVVLVGATNVGSIRLSFEPALRTNHAHKRKEQKITYIEPVPIKKGEELGMFCMGSTVIVVATAAWQELQTITQTSEPAPVQVGQAPA